MIGNGVELDPGALTAFCRKWRIRELSVFGSVLRDDFRPDSDVDVLVALDDPEDEAFDPIEAEEELGALVGRRVDLVEKHALKWVIRDRVLDSARVLYAA